MSADITIHNDQKNRNEKRGYIVDPDLQNKYPMSQSRLVAAGKLF